jgi:glycopeptidolipid biosynthesis protein
VELGEIDALLEELDEGSAQAVTLAVRNASHDVVRLTSFVRPMGTWLNLTAPELCQHIKSELSLRVPAYLIPSYICVVDAFPLNASGKTDRSVLERHARTIVKDGMRYPQDFVEAGIGTS